MEKFVINGGKKINGEVTLSGAKNSALPILTACVLINGTSVIHNCPHLSDVENTFEILKGIGCKISFKSDTVIIDSTDVNCDNINFEAMKRMRSSILFLGALLGREHFAVVSLPGGCKIGNRPVDFHIKAMRELGAEIKVTDDGLISASASRLIGEEIKLSFPSVGVTENIIIAAALSEGTTTIINAAREPEIQDLADFLNSAGARIKGAGEYVIKIEGVKSLHSTEHTIIPDRIFASTLMSACVCAGGSVVLRNVRLSHLAPIIPVYYKLGCKMNVGADLLMISAPKRAKAVGEITTNPYPAFPTDSQPLLTAALINSKGRSVINENIFNNRFAYASELIKLGANITYNNSSITINGVKKLNGATLYAEDLRGGAALAIAALAVNETTTVNNIEYIDRGYEGLENILSDLGANIKRVYN